MDVFIVIKEGLYRHEFFGAFDNFEKAKELAAELANTDNDGYHEYTVVKLPLNKRLDSKMNSAVGHTTRDDEPVFSIRKGE